MAVGKRSSERALQKVLGKGANVNEDNPLEVHDPKVGSLISYEGTTTADGAGDGSTLIDSVLTTKPDYNGNLVIITSGAYAGQGRDINGITTGGTVTPSSAFGGQILSGTNFVIVALRLTPAEVAAIEAKLDGASGLAALKAVVDAILVDTSTTLEAKLDNLGAFTAVENLKDILGAYTTAANLKLAIDAITTYVDLIDDVTNGLAAIKAEVEGLAGAAMRGTENAALAADWTAGLAAILANFTALRIGYLEELDFDLQGALTAIAGYIDTEIQAIITTLGTPANFMADVSILTDVTNGLAAIKAEVEGLAGVAMRGTDDALLAASYTAPDNAGITTLLTRITAAVALASVCTELRLAELDPANMPGNIDTLLARITEAVATAAALTAHNTALTNHDTALTAAKAVIDAIKLILDTPANFMADVSDLATILGLVDSGEAAGPFSYLNAGGEQDVLVDALTTRRRIWLDFSNRNMTQTGTFRIYRKVDGTNYDLYAKQPVTIGADEERAWDAEFTVNQGWKLTYEEDVDETADRDIDYNIITQVIE